MKKPKSYYGFAYSIKDPKRQEKYRKQRERLGFDDTETWDLGVTTITNFILPRLKRFDYFHEKRIVETPEHRLNMDKAINAFQKIKDHSNHWIKDEEYDEIKEGLQAFIDLYWGLWW